MPTDLTRETVARAIFEKRWPGRWNNHAFLHQQDQAYDEADAVLQTLSEPARLAAARAEGVREGIEMAAQYIHDWDPEKLGRPGMYASVDLAEAFDTGAIDASISIEHGVRALSPAPAEPSAPVAPEPVIKTIERVLDECSAWIARPSPDVTKRVAIAAGVAWQAAMDHEANRIPDLEEHIAALEAENAALKARNAKLVDGLRPFAVECNEWVEQVHLLPDATVPEIKAPSDDAVAAARFTLGDLRRARALLQGGPDAPTV